uniref:Putative secreted protein n=1 Tax=Anopheles marajoara TaxID=58244 RepID=A0A2M4CFQ1_9DIPT
MIKFGFYGFCALLCQIYSTRTQAQTHTHVWINGYAKQQQQNVNVYHAQLCSTTIADDALGGSTFAER